MSKEVFLVGLFLHLTLKYWVGIFFIQSYVFQKQFLGLMLSCNNFGYQIGFFHQESIFSGKNITSLRLN
jgi:hypothetical protein